MNRILSGAVVGLAASAVLAAPAAATPPGTNGSILWQRESRTQPPHLWVSNPDGSAARRMLTVTPGRGEGEGAFSPADPNVVLFTRLSPTPFSEDIYRGDLATGAVTRVTRAPSADIAPAVSPDGTRIAYFGVSRPRRLDPDVPPPPERLHVAALDGSGDRTLTSARRRSIDPDWSPDGQRLVYVEARFVGRGNVVQNRLMVINADGSGRRALTTYGGASDEVNPKWMPDGRTIIFERIQERGTRSDIQLLGATGGTPRTILGSSAWETNPVPSPDGTRVVFGSDRDRPGGDRLGPGFEIYTAALDGTGIVRLTNNRRPDIFPDWQRLP